MMLLGWETETFWIFLTKLLEKVSCCYPEFSGVVNLNPFAFPEMGFYFLKIISARIPTYAGVKTGF